MFWKKRTQLNTGSFVYIKLKIWITEAYRQLANQNNLGFFELNYALYYFQFTDCGLFNQSLLKLDGVLMILIFRCLKDIGGFVVALYFSEIVIF